MKKKDIQFNKIPDNPGVYIFRNAKKKILYIGKATSLRARVRSYFNTGIKDSRGHIITKMLDDANSLKWQETDSVLEALLLEANLIKKHQPVANSRDKDNKSFNYIIITKEEFPRVLIVRGRELFSIWNEKDIQATFGPFPQGGILRDGLKIIRKIFPFRDMCVTVPRRSRGTVTHKAKQCFNRQIGLCPGVCSGEITKTEYAHTIRHITLLLNGKKKALVTTLKRDMLLCAKKEQFERATVLKQKIFALTHIREAALLGSDYKVSDGDGNGRVEGYDVAHLCEQHRVGVMVVIENGKTKKSEYRKFSIRTKESGDVAALQEILHRRFKHDEWHLPRMLVIDGGIAQRNATQKVLDEFGYNIPIIHVVKNEHHQAGRIVGNDRLIQKYERDILLANSEAHRFAITFHKKKRHDAFL